jgi:hypothetical protein
VLKTLSWAAYLGASWTWCTGMFLPVLLVRDFGLWGWVVFALPNVAGAGAMGWAIRSDQSRRTVEAHRVACVAFSLVTLAFHGFFTFWMICLAAPRDFAWILAGMMAIFLLLLWRPTWHRLTAVGALAASIGCWVIMGDAGALSIPRPMELSLGLAGLAAACVLGFALCPYLDLTFHKARQSSPPMAFGIGFGIVFLSMIVFTLLYAGHVLGGPMLLRVLAVHWAVQTALTVGFHSRVILEHRTSAAWLLVIPAAAVLGIWASGRHAGELGELIYRLFMSCYGLFFPAYVLLRMIPPARPIWAWLAACAVASPFYWIAFIEGEMHWALAGVAIVLAARLLPAERRDARTPSA